MKKQNFNTCPSGKNTYETEWEAQKAVRDAKVLRNIKLSYYFCMYCFNYHMTSNLKNNNKNK